MLNFAEVEGKIRHNASLLVMQQVTTSWELNLFGVLP